MFCSGIDYNSSMGSPRNIMFDEEELKRICNMADSVGLTFSEFVRQCIRFGAPEVVRRLSLDSRPVTNVMMTQERSQ